MTLNLALDVSQSGLLREGEISARLSPRKVFTYIIEC